MIARAVALAALMLPVAACATQTCPPVSFVKADRYHAGYPGGVPGHSVQDYQHIAGITDAVAVCRRENGETVADITVYYSVETGLFYDGKADNEVYAALSQDHGNSELHRLTAKKTVHPVKGQQLQVSDTITGLVVGGGNESVSTGYDIVVGFVLSQGEIDYKKKHPAKP